MGTPFAHCSVALLEVIERSATMETRETVFLSTSSRVLRRRRAWSTSRTAIAAFLQDPAVTVRVREVGETGVVPACGVEPGCETSVPGINGYLVANLTDSDATFEQAVPHSIEVGDDEIDLAKRSDGRVDESATDLD